MADDDGVVRPGTLVRWTLVVARALEVVIEGAPEAEELIIDVLFVPLAIVEQKGPTDQRL